MASKSTITDSDVANGALSSSKINNFATQVISAMSSTLSNYILKSDRKAVKIVLPGFHLTQGVWTRLDSFSSPTITMDTSMVNASNGRITVSSQGRYRLSAMASDWGFSATVGVGYSINDGPQIPLNQSSASSSAYPQTFGSDIVELNANDYIKFYAYGSGNQDTPPGLTYISIFYASVHSL